MNLRKERLNNLIKIKNTAQKPVIKFGGLLSTRRGIKAITYWGVVAAIILYLFWGMPLPTKLISESLDVSTKIFDRNDQLIYEIYTDKKRAPIKLDDMPKHLKEATVAIEDKDFYKHQGVSYSGIVRAFYKTVIKRDIQGGSTISQQLVKNSLLTNERTLRRKAQELILTVVIESIYPKDKILEMYLNSIPYGGTAYGIETASETYFGKPAKDLSLAEAALLAGLPQRPSTYSPFGARPELAKVRQKEVLRQMTLNGYIDQEEADRAFNEELKYVSQSAIKAPHFALWIKEQLANKYGEKVVEQGGLRVYTTLDLEIQAIAEDVVATEVAKLKNQKVGNGAALVTRPSTGEILAMVGSKNYFAKDEDGKVNVILSERQPGSSIKPLNYALGLRDKNITLATAFADVPTCFRVAGQQDYCPRNYDNTYHGLVQTRFALGNSYNIPAVRILALNGLENFISFAREMGLTTITKADDYGLSATLGGVLVRPYDMAVAFGVFANQGIRQPLIAITKVTDWKGNILEEYSPQENSLTGKRVLDPEVTFLISHTLHDNNARSSAFGTSSYLNVAGHPEASVKTGTTNERRDNWTIGYTSNALVVTWVGNNDNTSMSGAVSGVSGASPIWNRIMKAVLDKAESGVYDKNEKGHAWPKQPDGIIGATICSDTGGSPPSSDPSDPGCPTRFEYFLSGTVPATSNIVYQDVLINNHTGQLASETDPPEDVHTENKATYTDPNGTFFCLSCVISSPSATIRYPF